MYWLKINFFAMLLWLCGTAISAQLSPAELDSFHEQALKRIRMLENYIQIIADKSRSFEERDDATQQALKLFVKGSTIEVLPTNAGGHIRSIETISSLIPVEKYFQRLKLLNYHKVKIASFSVPYANEWQVVNCSLYICRLQLHQNIWKQTESPTVSINEPNGNKQIVLVLYRANDPFSGKKHWQVFFSNIVLYTETQP